MEKLIIYEEGEFILCPKCGADTLDYDDAPTDVVCEGCKTHFHIKTVLFETKIPSL